MHLFTFNAYICINKNKQLNNNDMKATDLKTKVRAMLIKRGNSEVETDKMIELNFDFAITKYTNVSQIDNYLRIVY